MDSHAQSVEDNLIDSLSFKLKPGASYVTDRESVSFFPQGGNDYQPNGVKVIKISLNGDSWLDPSTVKIFFDVTNNSSGSDKIHPIVANGWGLFKRLRILCGGQIIEDIDNYGRLHQMFHLMKPSEKRKNDGIEGFGDWDDTVTDTIDNGKTRTIGFTPMSGLFSQGKYLPIRYAPIQVELELVSNGADVVNASGANSSKSFKL